MKIADAYPGQYLKAVDLKGKRVRVVIDRVEDEDIGGEHKPVVYFRGHQRGLVLNKTNATAIWGINGSDDTDDWRGTEITLFQSMVDFQGKRVPAIRIDPPEAPVRKVKPEPVPEPVDEGDESGVPF